MNFLLSILFCLFIGSLSSPLFAQNDPFGVRSSVDAAALSPSELPTFEAYKSDPENIAVANISPKTLSSTLRNSRGTYFLLDARSNKEYLVSRIGTARVVGFTSFSTERVWMLDRSAQVIVYSANKERGLVVAQYLKLMGFLDVQLLEGGLIGWKNAGYDVVDDNGKTDRVHVGKKSNTRLLKSGLAII
ncbi:MAG: rhodanese-like domain-containing protein [Aureispira sp.]